MTQLAEIESIRSEGAVVSELQPNGGRTRGGATLSRTFPVHAILDPFAGSSTTGIAAMLTGDPQFTGIEREKKYIDLSIKRHRDILASRATAWSVAVPLAA